MNTDNSERFDNQYSEKVSVLIKNNNFSDDEVFIKTVDVIINTGIDNRASDIYFEPAKSELLIKYRIDGVLYPIIKLEKKYEEPILIRLKVISKLVVYKKRKPQEGRIYKAEQYKNLDLRISIIPTIHGEKIAIRILGANEPIPELEQLGMYERQLNILKKNICRPQGLILFTGPAGSGKSTSIYSILKFLIKAKGEFSNICTIEDPVEFDLENIPQTNIDEAIDFSYQNALKTILRHDPNIIMLGEIRDKETAKSAIEAALTGHLIVTTIHSKSVAGVVTRLLNMDIEPYLVSSAVTAVISQKLIRKLCVHCKIEAKKNELENPELKAWDLKKMFKHCGCNSCNNTGYSGRTAIFEILEITEELADFIMHKPQLNEFENRISKNNFSIMQSGIARINEGITTVDEILRVL